MCFGKRLVGTTGFTGQESHSRDVPGEASELWSTGVARRRGARKTQRAERAPGRVGGPLEAGDLTSVGSLPCSEFHPRHSASWVQERKGGHLVRLGLEILQVNT